MKNLVISLLTLVAVAGSARAQMDEATSFAFNYRVVGTPALIGVNPAGTITFPDTNAGSKSSITFLITSSSKVLSLYAIGNLTVGGTGFTASLDSSAVPPQAAGYGSIALTFTPTSAGPVNGSLQFTLMGPNQQFTYTFSLFANGLAPRVVTSYILPTTGDQLPVQSGDVIAIPLTSVGSSSATTFVIANTGTGSTTVDSVSLVGAGFTLTNLGLVPATISAGNDFRFQITLMPTAAQAYTGSLQVSIGGRANTYALRGQGASSALSYQVLTQSGNQAIQPGATITLPDTPADGSSSNSVTVQVTNTGNLDAPLTTINATGTDFQLSNLPILPVTLKANGGATLFSIVYQPKTAGPSTGRLQIGNDLFNLSGNGLGALLTYSVNVGTGNIALPVMGTIAVPNTTVGAKRNVSVAVTNSGNQPATISSFSVSGSAFSAVNLPPLPVTLAPSQTQQFQFTFAPAATGQATGALAINNQTFTVVAAADAPPPLPQATFTGVQSTTSPLQQPAAGLQLASAYPYDITGVLTLSFLSDSFVDDPSIQFATGSRTVNFTIPANTTQALFGQLGKSAPFQTGTLSGTVSLSASFQTGAVDITPPAAPVKTTVIPAGAPQLRSVRANNPASGATQASNSIQLLISGYSTTRTVSQLAFQLTGATGANLQTSGLTTDVTSAFTSWYANPSSKVFGSQFTVTVTLNLTGDLTALQTISVTASNAQGASSPVSVTLR